MKTLLLIILIGSLLVITGCAKQSGNYDSLASCMTANGATMYGTEWCPHCKNQKAMFGNSFALIDFVDCDKDKNACIAAGIQGYPTWIINGTKYEGTQSLYTLAEKSGCSQMLTQ